MDTRPPLDVAYPQMRSGNPSALKSFEPSDKGRAPSSERVADSVCAPPSFRAVASLYLAPTLRLGCNLIHGSSRFSARAVIAPFCAVCEPNNTAEAAALKRVTTNAPREIVSKTVRTRRMYRREIRCFITNPFGK